MTALADKTVSDLQTHTPGLDLQARGLVTIAWALAKLGRQEPELMRRIAARAQSAAVLADFTCQGISMTAWAFATLRIVDDALLAALAGRMVQRDLLAACGAQHLATTIWAYAACQVLPPPC